jgi:DNA-binding MarR family transcriptional regulator
VGKGSNVKNPFTKEAIKIIYEETGGFPREILRLCDFAVNKAIEKNLDMINADIFKEKEKEPITQFSLDDMPRRQREVLEAIIENKNTPNEILEYIDLSKYKSRYHALRSVNNILQRLIKEGYVERRKHGKTYYYTLSPKLRNLLVKA